VTQYDHYLKFLDLLNSNVWNERSRATVELKKINDAEVLYKLFKVIEDRNDDNLRFNFIILLETLLSSPRHEVSGTALFGLVLWNGKSGSHSLNNKSHQLIQDYIKSSKVLRYMKIKSIRYAWGRLPRSKRDILLEVISKNHLKELSNIVLTCFQIRDDDLWIKAINTLIKFKDKRGNRYIKKILQSGSKNQDLLNTAIRAIGTLGSFYDYKLLKPYFESSHLKIQISTIRSYSKILGAFSVNRLEKIFLENENDRIKLEVLSRLGKINHKKSCTALIRFLHLGIKGDVGLHVDWALHDCENRIKIPLLIASFHEQDDKGKVRVLNFFTDVYDFRLEDFILNVLRSDQPDIIQLMTLNLCSGYPSDKIKKLLEDYIFESTGLKSYTALLELYQINKLEDEKILFRFFEQNPSLDYLSHHVILKKLSEGRVSDDLQLIALPYLENILTHGRVDLVNLVFDCLLFNANESLVEKGLEVAKNTSLDVIRDHAIKVFAKLIKTNNRYLKILEPLFHDKYFLIELSSGDVSKKFIFELSSFLMKRDDIDYTLFFNHTVSLVKDRDQELFKGIKSEDMLNQLYRFWVSYDLRFSEETIERIIGKYYSMLNEENKISFLKKLSQNARIHHMSFFYKEVILRKEALAPLVNQYIRCIHEEVL
tara:strand:+ start:1017 stop:2978 length:1962 start_codon:yes stop_codon:yes gene_type:complete